MRKSLGPKVLTFPTPVWVVGTYDSEGNPNVMTAAWGGICCSKPPCLYVSLRKATYSYGNIEKRKAFTVSIPSETYVQEADYFGIATGKTVNKLAIAGLTPIKSDIVDAPYVKEFPMTLECSLMRSVEIGLHTEFIGEILDVKVDESVLNAEGLPDIEKIKPILFEPEVRTYHGVGKYLGQAFSIGKGKLTK